jgi:hypothetical protein
MEALRNRSSLIFISNCNLLFIFILIAVVPLSAMNNFRGTRYDDSINYDHIRDAVENNDVPRLISLLTAALGKKQKIAGELSNKLSALLHSETISPVIAGVLIRYGAKVNHRDILFETPLHRCRTDVVDVLVSNNAEVNAENRVGNTPLLIATRRRNIPKVRSLVGHGANIGHRNKKTKTAIDIAIDPDDDQELTWFLLVKQHKAKNIPELLLNREIYGTFRSPY